MESEAVPCEKRLTNSVFKGQIELQANITPSNFDVCD
jgi:hypothetical protein